MKFRVLTIGKLKNKNLLNEVNELSKRVSKLEVVELKEVKEKNVEILKKKEFELIKPHLNSSFYNVLLWEFGEEFNTKDFYSKFKNVNGTIQFIITGAFGPCEDLKNCVDFKLSLSKMTFTHEQAFYMLIEQIYRLECFRKGIDYTK